MDRETLVGKFAQSVGIEKAESLLASAEAELELEGRSTYDSQEVQDLCQAIQYSADGYVAQVANEIRVHEQAEERFAALLANVPDPAVVVTLDDSRPVVSSANDAFVETFGFDRSTAEGRSLVDLVVPEDLDATAAESEWLITAGHGPREVRRVTATGESRTFLFRSGLATREVGQVEGYGIYTDITERKQRERKLRSQNERLEQILDMVSHDLRNPLNVANGRLELLLDDVDDESIRDELAEIRTSQERMEQLVDDLLRLARRGAHAEETEAVDLAAVSHSAWKQVQTGDAVLRVDVADDTIQAAPQRLAELLENLFRNAVEHNSTSPRSGAHEDAAEHRSTSPDSQARESAVDRGSTNSPSGGGLEVRVGTIADDDRSGFYVADNGPGIDEPEAVFERGYSTAESGTGLGLSIVDTIAGAHGWEVGVTESWAGGARFEFRW